MKRAIVIAALLLTAMLAWWGEDSGWRIDRHDPVRDPEVAISSPRPTTIDEEGSAVSPDTLTQGFRIVDPRGDPIAGVLVERISDPEFSRVIQATHTTDRDGVVVGLEVQSGYGLARADGFAWRQFRLDWTATVALDPEHPLVGRLVDDRDQPLPDRELMVRGVAAGGDGDVRTDSRGHFRVRGLAQGFVHIYASWEGYEPVECEWAPGEPEPTLVAKRRPIVRGRVLDPEGRPVIAAIEDASLGYAIRALGALGSSDAEGWFELKELCSGNVELVAAAPGIESEPLPMHLEPGSETKDVILRLRRERVIASYLSVRVIGEDDRPLPGVRLHWMQQAWRPSVTRTDQFGIAALPPARGSFVWNLSGGYTPPPPVSDDEGIYRFAFDLPPGTPITIVNWIDLFSDTLVLPTLRNAITQPAADALPIELRLHAGVVRRLRVQPPDMASSLILDGPAIALPVADGVASFLVDPDAVYRICAEPIIERFVVRDRWTPPQADLVTDVEVSTPVRDESNPRILRGRVVNAAGNPIPGVRIAMVEGALTGVADSAMTLADGSFEVEVRGSEVHLQFDKRGYGSTMRRYRADAAWAPEVMLHPAAQARISILPPGDFRAHDWRLEVRAAGWTESIDYELGMQAKNRFFLTLAMHLEGGDSEPPFLSQGVLVPGSTGELDQLPPGRLELRLWTDGYELKKSVELVSGETAEVEFQPR